MLAAQLISDTDTKLKEYLEIWAKDQLHDDTDLSYPHQSAGFLPGGDTWGTCIEDLEETEDYKVCRAIDAIMESMPDRQQEAIRYFHIAGGIKPNRWSIEDAYELALFKLEIGLRGRGFL